MSTNGDTGGSVSDPGVKGVRGSVEKPVVAVTMGDPAGIGPEVVLKALSDGALKRVCVPVIVGDAKHHRKTADSIGLKINLATVGVDDFREASDLAEQAVVDLANVPDGLILGEESPIAGNAAGQYIEAAVKACITGNADAVATAPINKRSFNAGGYDFPGHTEFLAHLTECDEYAMCFFADSLRVVLLSTHVSLSEAVRRVKRDALTALIRLTDRELQKLLGRNVKIAVAGLNPHASEGGMFGNEELDEIEPAVDECRKRHKVDVTGPYPPDTVFLRAFNREFDAVIACYHDQATIAVKCLTFGRGVNVTLGLPIIRTSVDHGTAFEIAGQNKADAGSLKSAIELAAELSKTLIGNSIIR